MIFWRLNDETDENTDKVPAQERRDTAGGGGIRRCSSHGDRNGQGDHDKQTTDDGLEVYYLAPMLDPVNNYLNYESPDHVETAKELKEANNG